MSLSEYVRREDLKTLYALPMKDASKKLGVSESSLRNICRKHNIERWPYRKFQQLDAHIASLQNVEVSQQSQQQKEMIESLLRARSILEDNPNMTCEMAILQANKQLLANNPSSNGQSQIQEMTAQMMHMMNQASINNQYGIGDDASPTISTSNGGGNDHHLSSPSLINTFIHHQSSGGSNSSSPQLHHQQHPTTNNNVSNSNNNTSTSNFVPSYPTHVTSHLSASAALSAMARRKKNPQYVHSNTNSSSSSSSILEALDQQQQFNNNNNNRFTGADQQIEYPIPQQHYLHHHQALNHVVVGQQQQPIHMRSMVHSTAVSDNSGGGVVGEMQMGERRGAVSHRDSVALGQGFVLLNQNSLMDDSNESNSDFSSSMMMMNDQHNDHYNNNQLLLDPNLKSRHISLMKQQRRPSPQPPRSLSTSTALSSSNTSSTSNNPMMFLQQQQQWSGGSGNGVSNSSVGGVGVGNRKFTSPSSSPHNSSLRSSSASHTDFFDSPPFIDICMQDQEGDISMGDNFLSSPSILINSRLSDDQNGVSSPQHFYQRTSQSSLTSQVSLNRYLLESPNHHDFDFVSKQEQRENNHRILEALRVTPTTTNVSNVNNGGSGGSVGSVGSMNVVYDPLFDSNAFLRGRTSSVSSTFSDTLVTTPMTPTEGRLSNASNMSSLRLSHGMNSEFFQ